VCPGRRGRAFGPDIRQLVDGTLNVSHIGRRWRFLPANFGMCRCGRSSRAGRALTRDVARPGKQPSKARTQFTGALAWTVAT
jgi:hypothetical protein